MNFPIRINKYLRDRNLASRREADVLVEQGRVFVNKKPATIGMMIQERDEVTVKGNPKKYQYLAYNKPRGLPTQDFEGQQSVITEWKRKGLYPIGRLDKDSDGLLILTNDGRYVRKVLSQYSKYEKEYIVRVKERLRAGIPRIFKGGLKTKTLGTLLPAESEIINPTTIRIILHEGKKHQIRIMLNEMHYTVVSLTRVRIGDIKLGDLKPGQTRAFTPEL